MSNDCSCNSSECGSSCSSGSCGSQPGSFIEKTHEYNSIKRVIGIVSGKGGVGKSLVTSMLSVMMSRKGYNVGILDADITGPSIPKMFGITKKAEGNEYGIYPQTTHNNIKVMSVNLLLEEDDAPVIWRGPVIAGTVKQFWTDVLWGDVDFLFLDMPPGTGDVPLTVFQSIPLDGIVIVTSPQDLVSMIVKKAFNMAKTMNIPILGIVENMSYFKCSDCGREVNVFGNSKIAETSQKLGIKLLGKIPLDTEIADLCDKGEIEKFGNAYLAEAANYIESHLAVCRKVENDNMIIAIPTEGTNVSGHFGKCELFTIIELKGSQIIKRSLLNTQGNQHGLLPAFLASHNVNTLIAGGMGDGARQNLVKAGIEIVSGITGNIDTGIEAYINGNLESKATGCIGHEHSHSEGGCSCGNH